MREAIRLFDSWLAADVAYERVPGLAIGIVADQQLVWARGYGFADAARRIPVSTSTPFSVCSISKLFTATAVLQLRDAGKISLDDPVSRHVPSFNARSTHQSADAITVRRLLTHASGLPRDFPYASWTGPEYEFPTHAQVLEYLQAPAQSSTPGSRHEYSNVGMTLAGEVVRAVSAMPFDEYLRTRIFEPLGMIRTFPDQNSAARGGIGYWFQRAAARRFARANPSLRSSWPRSGRGNRVHRRRHGAVRGVAGASSSRPRVTAFACIDRAGDAIGAVHARRFVDNGRLRIPDVARERPNVSGPRRNMSGSAESTAHPAARQNCGGRAEQRAGR